MGREPADLARLMIRRLGDVLDSADPRRSIRCRCCGSKVVRGGQFAHDADCPALGLEMAVLDAADRLGGG